MQHPSKLLLLLSFIFLQFTLHGQQPVRAGQYGQANGRSDTIPEGLGAELQHEIEDTSHIFYFYAENPYEQFAFNDTLLDQRFVEYDPIRQQPVDYFHLGNLGSAHHPIFYDGYNRQGFDVGFHQFDLYKAKELKYYVVDTPYSEAFYSQGPKQEDAYFKANFSRNFAEGLNFSLNYYRINNVGNYQRQKSRNTSLALGMWYQKGRYDGFLTYINNVIQQQDNGGIETDTFFNQDLYQQRENIPIELETANTRHADESVTLTQHFKLRRTNDSTGIVPKRNFRITHIASWQTLDYKFDDESVTDDSLYYGQQLVDSRGLRHFVSANNLSNYFGLATYKSKNSDGLQSSKDNFEVGLKHRVYFINQEPESSRTVNNLMLTGNIQITPNNKFTLKAAGHFCFWDNAGDYRIKGELGVDLGQAGKLAVSLKQQRYAPSLVQQKFYISQVQMWDNDFTKPIETKLAASYRIPFVDVTVDGAYQLLNNPIYFDTLATPIQHDGAVSLLQFLIKKDFKLGKLHLDNTVALQTSSSDVIRVPSLYTKNSLYFEGLVFKKVMLLKAGLDLRMASDYFVPAYSEVIGQFHLQDNRASTFYPIVDFSLAFKVTRFRGFIKMENITSYLTDDIFYPTYNSPLFEQNFRAGLTWRFSG